MLSVWVEIGAFLMEIISRGLNVRARGSAQVPDVPFLSARISEEPSLTMRTILPTCGTPSIVRICYVSGALVITRTLVIFPN